MGCSIGQRHNGDGNEPLVGTYYISNVLIPSALRSNGCTCSPPAVGFPSPFLVAHRRTQAQRFHKVGKMCGYISYYPDDSSCSTYVSKPPIPGRDTAGSAMKETPASGRLSPGVLLIPSPRSPTPIPAPWNKKPSLQRQNQPMRAVGKFSGALACKSRNADDTPLPLFALA